MATTLMRHPRVAGSFYPRSQAECAAALDRCYAGAAKARLPLERRRALGCVAPHAGWVYSGGIAAKTFARIDMPPLAIVLSPNHTGLGARLAIWPSGEWHVPTGRMAIDERATARLCAACPDLERDLLAHEREHGIEVLVPFLLRERADARLVAIVLGTQDPDRLFPLADAITALVRDEKGGAVIVASSDMNHFEDQATTLRKDERALARVAARDPLGLLQVCAAEGISMCGAGPTAVMLRATNALGASRAAVVDHATSGDVCGDLDRVVGYAGVIVG